MQPQTPQGAFGKIKSFKVKNKIAPLSPLRAGGKNTELWLVLPV
jgi:hypothetical protein